MDFDDLIPIIGIIVSALISFLKKDKKKKRNLSVNKSQPIKEKNEHVLKPKEIIKEEIKEQVHEVSTLYESEIILKEEKKDEIQMNEIGKENFIWSQNDLIKGMILSEILDKPKALRKKL